MIEPALGTACGALAGLWFDVVALKVFRSMARQPGSRAAALARSMNPVLFFSPLLLFHALWTLAGLLLGVAYRALAQDGSGGVDPVFVAIMGAVAGAGGLLSVAKTRARALWPLSFAAAFFLLFGLLLPYWATATR